MQCTSNMCSCPVIRSVSIVDAIVTLSQIGYIVSVGIHTDALLNGTDDSVSVKSIERRYVFFLLSCFLLGLRTIAAVYLFVASFKGEFRKQFNACVLYMLVALGNLVIVSVQLLISTLTKTEKLICLFEIVFRIICSIFVIRYMKNEQMDFD